MDTSRKDSELSGGYTYAGNDTEITVRRKPCLKENVNKLAVLPPFTKPYPRKTTRYTTPFPHYTNKPTMPVNRLDNKKEFNKNKFATFGGKAMPLPRYYLPSKSLHNNDTGIQVQEDDYFDYYTNTEQ